MKVQPRGPRRRICPAWLGAVLAIGLSTLPAGAQDPPAAGEGYLEQLRVEREEGWLRRELRRLRTYPHLDRAYRLMDEDRLEEARDELQRYLTLDADDLEVRYTSLLLAYRMKDHAEVIRQANELLEARPQFVPARLYRALASLARGDAEGAESDFRLAAADSGATAAHRRFALEMWADLAYRQHRYGDAASALDQLEAAGADSSSLHFRRGLVRQAEGRAAEARTAFHRALERAQEPPERLRALRALGEIEAQLGNWRAAEEALVAATELAPREPGLRRSLAHVASRQGQHLRAAERMGQALELEFRPQDLEFRANALFQHGDLAGAAEGFSRLAEELEAPRDRHRAYLALGATLERLSRYRQAAEAFEQAARLDDDPETLSGWARALAGSGRWLEAIRVYRRLLASHPHPQTHLHLAMAYAEAGETEQAIRHLRTAAQAAIPSSLQAAAYRQLGFLEAGRDRHQAALDAFEAALALGSERDAELYFALGETCSRLREFDRAVAYFEQGLALEQRPSARRALAWAHVGAGRPEVAVQIYRQLLEASSAEAQAADILVRIANLELEMGRPAAAADLFVEALERQASPEPGLLAQAAESLVQAGRLSEALEVNRELLGRPELNRSRRAEALERQGEIETRLERFDAAIRSFHQALEAGREGGRLRQALGFLHFKLGRWPEALEQFRRSLELAPSPRARLYLARCYDLLGRPGTALYHLKQIVPELDRLPPEDQRTVLEELGYLHAQQAAYEAAAGAWKARLDLAYDPRVALRLGETLRRLGRSVEAQAVLSEIEPGTLSPALEARRLEQLGEIALAAGEAEVAAERFRAALDLETSAARQHLLGIAYQAMDRPHDAVEHFKLAATAAPETTRYRESLGYSYVAIDAVEEAIEVFETLVAQDPDYLSLYQDLGYLHLKRANAPQAIRWFEQAIANRPLYPVRTAEDEAALEQTLGRMRQEVSRLSNRLDVTLYLAARSDSLPFSTTPALTGGVLPSQGGVELAFLPPRLGFRNERVFQIFGRVLTDVRPGSLDPQEDSYQGGLGARYKPLRSHNLFLSGERLFKIGDDAQDNWLLRALYSWGRGYALRPGQRRWSYTLLYLDAGYLLEAPSYRALFGELRQGLTFNLGDRLLLTPHLLVGGRYQDPGGATSSYLESGGGLSLKLFFASGRDRGAGHSLELLAQYRAGRFVDRDAAVADDDFDGFLTTAILQF